MNKYLYIFLCMSISFTALCDENSEQFNDLCVDDNSYKFGSEKRIFLDYMNMFWKRKYEEQYKMFSERYKKGLERAYDIKNMMEYAKAKSNENYERVWYKREVLSIKMPKKNIAKITALECWEQEGYTGKLTVTYELIKMHDSWFVDFIIR